ncbi:MAG: tetratricopeptide repeat protein [Deltaproteobacteria bacterium]|nr:tetratricopeptide repeat protein [Deltaproteobacteria bacterium]
MRRKDRSRGHPLAGEPPVRFSVILLTVIIVLLVTAGAWLAFYPQDLRRLSQKIWTDKPVIKYLKIVVNDREMVLKPDQTAYLHPDDSLSRISFTSNRLFNFRLRLYSPELDVYAIENSVPLSQILAWEDFTKPYELVIQVKEGAQVLANFTLVVRITALDLEEQADRAQDINEAITLYRKALTLDPNSEDVKRKLVVLLEQTGDYRSAAAIYEEMIKEKTDAEVLKKLLSIYQTSMNYRKLVHTFHRLIKISPAEEARLFLYQLAKLQVDLRQYGEAITTLETLKNRLPQEQRADILKQLGYLYAKTKNPDKSIEVYEEAAQVDKTDPNIYYNLMRLYQVKGDMAGYRKSLVGALRANPTDLDTRYKLAQAYAEAGEIEKAEEEFRRLLEVDPNYLEARLELIKLLEKSGQIGPQIEEYEFLLAKKPDDKVVRYNLGALYFEAGKLDQSKKYMEELARLDPNDYEAKQFLFEIYRRQNKEKEAYRLAKELTRLAPEFESSYDFIFNYLDQRGYYQDLANQAAQWISRRPQSIKFREYLAYAHIKQNKLDLVVQDYEAMLKIKPKDVSLMLKLAQLYEGVGKIDAAIKMYDQILKIEPDYEQAAQARLRLSLERLKIKKRE